MRAASPDNPLTASYNWIYLFIHQPVQDRREGQMAEKPRREDEMAVEDVETLRSRHRELEERLAFLERHLSLTSAEQAERVRLKKEKLVLKDRIQALSGG